ncbi:unnamed protein product [Closterium sp. NIES-64]|nr:unnamed protein product [Closterium sp. NIES-64]
MAPADVRLEIRKKYEAQAAAKEEKQRAVLAAIASVKAGGKRARMTDYLEGDAAAAKSEAHEATSGRCGAAGSRKEVAEKFAAQVLDTAWWKTAEFFTKLMQLPFKAMRMTDGEAKGMMGRIYDVMLQLTEDVEALVDANEEQLCISDKKQICRILKDRWDESLACAMHVAGRILNPVNQEEDIFGGDAECTRVFKAFLHQHAEFLVGHDGKGRDAACDYLSCVLWRIEGECDNYMVLKGHKNVILELQWTSDGHSIVSASPDQDRARMGRGDGETDKEMAEHSSFVNSCCLSLPLRDSLVFLPPPLARLPQQIKKMAEHSSFVNSCCPAPRGPPLIVSGSDDGTAKLWDMRVRGCIQTFPDKYQVGGPDGAYLLTNAMDCTLRIWDLRPYAPQNRCVKIFTGHQHSVEKNLLKCDWSPDGSRVTAGTADRMVYVWDTTMRRILYKRILYKLPGHNGSVNEAVFHPSQPIIGSCSSDKRIYLGELDPSLK